MMLSDEDKRWIVGMIRAELARHDRGDTDSESAVQFGGYDGAINVPEYFADEGHDKKNVIGFSRRTR